MLRAEWWLAALLLSGCAGPLALLRPEGGAPRFADPRLGVESAAQSVVVGRSTRAEVRERLGPAEVVAFDSGYEVWVYRAGRVRTPAATPELVILFGPPGVVTKVRARPAYPPAPA